MANSNGSVYGENIGIPYARLGWLQLNPPVNDDKATEAYSAKFIIDPDDTETLNRIDAECNAVAQAAWGTTRNIKMPLHDATEDEDEESATAGSYYCNAKSWYKPTLVDRKGKPLENDDVLYSGCYVMAVVKPQSYVYQGQKGIKLNLVAIGFKNDGERLGGAPRDPESIFGGVGLKFDEEADEAPAPAPAEKPKVRQAKPKAAKAEAPAPVEDTSGGELPFEFGNDTGFEMP